MTDRTLPPPILIGCAHGTRNPAGRATVQALLRATADLGGLDVRAAFADAGVQRPSLPETLAALPSPSRAVVVPLLLGHGFHVSVDIETAAAAAPIPTITTPTLGPDPILAEVLRDRLTDCGATDSDDVVLAAVGSTRARAVADVERAARLLGERLGRPVPVGYLTTPPALADVVAGVRRRNHGRRIAVALYLLAPSDLEARARTAGADLVSAPLLPGADRVEPRIVQVLLNRYHHTPA